MPYLLAALLGALAGALGGLVGAVLLLQARHLRNGVLVRRGLPPIRDAVLTPLHVPGALFGGIAAPLFLYGYGHGLVRACALGALGPLALALLLCGIVLGSAVRG
ncbi:MAG: hypothetical protein U1A78_21035 [Polyangia bacterium]